MGLGGKEIVTFGNDEVKVPSLSTLDSTTLRPINTQNDSPEKGKKETKKEIKKEEKETKKEIKKEEKETKRETKKEEKEVKKEIKREEKELDINIEAITQEDFVKKIDALDTPEKLKKIYDIIQNNIKLSNFIRNTLSLEQKVNLLEKICDNVTDFKVEDKDGTLFQKRHDLKEKIFREEDEKVWLKGFVLSERKGDNIGKIAVIKKIEKYFRVTDIITRGLGYNRQEIGNDQKIIRQVSDEALKEPDLYVGAMSHINTQIGRAFLLRFLGAGERLRKMSDTGIINKKTQGILRNYAGSGGRFNGLIQTLSYLDEDSQRRINDLEEAGLVIFLDNLSKDPEIGKKIKNIMGYDRDERIASKVTQLLITETGIQKVLKTTEQELLENPKFLESQEYQEIKSRAFFGSKNIKTAQILYQKELIKKDPNIVAGLNEQEKHEKIEKIWNTLSDKEKIQYQQKAWEQDPEESRILLKTEYRRHINKKIEDADRVKAKGEGINYDDLPITQQRLRIESMSYAVTRNFAASYVEPERMNKIDQELESIRNQNNQDLLISAQKYGFTEDLRQVRGEKYYEEVEQQYITSYKQKFETTELIYQNSNLGSHINNQVFGSIEEQNQIFGNREIPKDSLNKGLTSEEYELYLNKIYPDKVGEKSLYNDTNTILKEEFKNRIVYFLGNCFDIKLDSDSQTTLLETFDFDKNNKGEKNTNGEISLTGKSKDGKKIKIAYNTESGLVKVGKRIHVDNNSGSIDVDKEETTLSLVKGPKIDNFYEEAKKISYSDILKDGKTNSISDYSEEISNQLKILVPLENQGDFAQEELNKNFLINLTLQEIGDVVGIRSQIENGSIKEISPENKELFALLGRSLSAYNKQQLTDFRGVVKFMIGYNQEFLSKQTLDKKSPQYIDKKLDDFGKSISRNNFKKARNITNIVFEKLNKEKEGGSFDGSILYDFFRSFLSNKESFSGKNTIIDTEKLLTYHEDLSQEDKTDKEIDYIDDLNENMKVYLAEYGLNEYITDNSQNVNNVQNIT